MRLNSRFIVGTKWTIVQTIKCYINVAFTIHTLHIKIQPSYSMSYTLKPDLVLGSKNTQTHTVVSNSNIRSWAMVRKHPSPTEVTKGYWLLSSYTAMTFGQLMPRLWHIL